MGKNTNPINKKIGILGGMGPQATGELYRLLIEKSISDFALVHNNDFPEIIIDSIPVPDFISDTKNLQVAREMLIQRTKQLNAFGVGQICIPCNTAHMLIQDIREASDVPVLSIMDEVRRVVIHGRYLRVGLFASPMTIKSGLYDLFNEQVMLFIPNHVVQNRLEGIIRSVIAGQNRKELQPELTALANTFKQIHDLDVLILGCTELPLVAPENFSVPIISSLDVLAHAALHKALRRDI